MKKILVAEDNDSNYILMTYILKRYYEFCRAKNGQEAVEMADAGGIDLILMDIKMPVMDGMEATVQSKKCKAISECAYISDDNHCLDKCELPYYKDVVSDIKNVLWYAQKIENIKVNLIIHAMIIVQVVLLKEIIINALK